MWSSIAAVLVSICGCSADHHRSIGPDDVLVVLLQPIGKVPPQHLDVVRVALQAEHSSKVHLAPELPLPAKAYTAERFSRYRADTLIAWLRGIKPDSVDLIIGLTAQDISITKYDKTGAIKEPAWKYRDFGVFGLGYMGGQSCVVSTFRLGEGKSARFLERLKKVAVHEVGHNRGLPHCPDERCVMRDAVERIASIDSADTGLCTACSLRR